MTQDTNAAGGATIGNATEIIDRFGGIRPMSTKTGIPVTTIQGWKQRNAIPASRRNELIEAANRHGVVLGDLLMEIAGVKEVSDAEFASEDIVLNSNAINLGGEQRSEDLRPAGHQTTMIAAGALVLAAGVLGIILALAPKLNGAAEQTLRIQELEQQLAAMRDAKESADAGDSILPEALVGKISELEGRVGALSEQAKSYASVAQDLQTGSVAQRIAKLEGHVGGLVKQANMQGLQSLLHKVTAMQGSAEGLGQLDSVMAAFVAPAESASKSEDLAGAFTKLRETNPQVAETFKDVAPEDMRAAVMLLGMAQLRDSLARDNQSFETDLKLLKATLAKDDPALQAAIDRLAPQAKAGVLTPDGLSRELRSMTGEIVAASLAGEEVSIQDKALARLNDVVKVEKGGAQISGTSTQITIAEAQKRLDSGDVEGAVALLQQIQGPAAQKTKPLVDAAQATMMASQVQQLLGQNLALKLKGVVTGALGKGPAYTASGGGLDPQSLINQVKGLGLEVGQ